VYNYVTLKHTEDVAMAEVKTRKQGNSVAVTLPAQFNVALNQIMVVKKLTNGSILLVPKVENPFLGGEAGDMYDSEFSDLMRLTDSELD
jgi:hypothetical protein